MLTNIDLEQYAERENFDLIGVFSKDKLPKQRISGSYIVNLQNYDDGNGTHWVCFKIFNNGDTCYFDPFGLPMPIHVCEFLKPFKPICQSNRDIQDTKSDKCGYFCLAFIKHFDDFDEKLDVYEAFDDWLNCFSINTKVNDKIVMELLKKY